MYFLNLTPESSYFYGIKKLYVKRSPFLAITPHLFQWEANATVTNYLMGNFNSVTHHISKVSLAISNCYIN